MVWIKGLEDEAFRFTVIVDVVEDERLCIPANVPPWNDGEEYCLVGDGAHADTIGNVCADNGTLGCTSAGATVFKKGDPGPGSELDSALTGEAVRRADGHVDEARLGTLRVGDDVVYEKV